MTIEETEHRVFKIDFSVFDITIHGNWMLPERTAILSSDLYEKIFDYFKNLEVNKQNEMKKPGPIYREKTEPELNIKCELCEKMAVGYFPEPDSKENMFRVHNLGKSKPYCREHLKKIREKIIDDFKNEKEI